MATLTRQQRQELGQQLDARRQALSGDLQGHAREAAEAPPAHALSTQGIPGDPGDMIDRGEHALRTAMRHAEKERDQQELLQIADAQARMQAGTYGRCVDCDAPIALERLQALPFAERCIPCQELYERDGRGGVRVSLGNG